MKFKENSSKKSNLEEIREQFETWRKTREKRAAIPDVLWEAAVSLCPRYSLCQISKALRLNYSDLKHRVQASQSMLHSSPIIEPAFIDIGFKSPMLPAECIVEMEDQNGAKMSMYFKGEAGLDLLELGKVFWCKQS
ncbi:MAG: hypothetical protein DRH24_11685 [Deltaproteobacteria bacterium]|nr:MAG: hypothetical protein DRH24_11685 [Deltaproteobacteria bacterium]